MTIAESNQTGLILLALDKALADNCERLNRQEQQSMTQAVLNTVAGTPVPETTNKPEPLRRKSEGNHADTIPNS